MISQEDYSGKVYSIASLAVSAHIMGHIDRRNAFTLAIEILRRDLTSDQIYDEIVRLAELRGCEDTYKNYFAIVEKEKTEKINDLLNTIKDTDFGANAYVDDLARAKLEIILREKL